MNECRLMQLLLLIMADFIRKGHNLSPMTNCLTESKVYVYNNPTNPKLMLVILSYIVATFSV